MAVYTKFSFSELIKIVHACDDAYDGLFFYAVKTTGIVCRPSCKSRRPNKINITFFQTFEEAKRAGFRPCKRCRPDTIRFNPKMEVINDTKAYIQTHYKENITMQHIARHIGISPYYLGRLFKKIALETPRCYLEKIRINKALQLLKTTNLSIVDICYEAGFQNSSSFYHAFRKHFQQTPQQYRKTFSHNVKRTLDM
ncbi:bifunctional transcriptional activator/DNA repair enzyme AdaA [Alteribacillus sp. YIM 98480]|uniref:bifunctional transcriptional activator/DNA repair enzyme AdaA n=1 Tax=Alteribacillus sp. YIM 98480 TaxID=2606599 RepID=UPI00131C1FC1|nr:Ada metal-binding domain-containing protein [Alteribacillus sp. YIM 98480]